MIGQFVSEETVIGQCVSEGTVITNNNICILFL